MSKLAPIGLSTYGRINHLKKTVESLRKNTLAKKSDLFIFSDAPKKGDGDEEKVRKVRDYIRTISGFRKVHIIERKENNRVFNNRDGMRQLLDKYGKIIFMEEDNVSHPMFLKYMNEALDFFYPDKKIFAIGGYCLPVKFKSGYKNNFFLSVYFGAPFATWNNRGFIKAIKRNDQYLEVKKNDELEKKIKETHPQIFEVLSLMHEGKLNAGDYRINFYMRKNDLYCVCPVKSLIRNIGYDGSGEHCGSTNRLDVDLDFVGRVNFIKNYKYDQKMDREFYNYKRLWIYKLPRPFRTVVHLISKNLGKLKK